MVTLVGQELAQRLPGVEPNDFLVSLRNISAVVVLGRSNGKIKQLFKGSFLLQHSAQAAPGGKIIIFDNLGASYEGGPSRVLLYDPVTGEERTVLPNAATEGLPLFARVKGNIDISSDGTRALVAVAQTGTAYEIRLADGAILTTFDNLHDLHSVPQFAQRKTLARFTQNGVYYVSPNLLN
jgi:hypothetical protein